MKQSDKIIGIDLGTTNSVLAVIQDGVPVLLPVNG
jgi:molecular chaperone DnaK (HSP70)